jgi:RNA polymerase sigma factor (sigma-70 family)
MRSGRGATIEELEALYQSGFHSFLRVATAVAGDQEAGRDAVQSAFVSAVRNRRSFRREGSLEGWLWTIVVREARRAAPTSHDSIDEAAELAGTNGADAQDPDGVRRFIASLPPRQREAVFLRYFADLDYRTIARILDVEPGTVSATLSTAHQTLRKRLEARAR